MRVARGLPPTPTRGPGDDGAGREGTDAWLGWWQIVGAAHSGSRGRMAPVLRRDGPVAVAHANPGADADHVARPAPRARPLGRAPVHLRSVGDDGAPRASRNRRGPGGAVSVGRPGRACRVHAGREPLGQEGRLHHAAALLRGRPQRGPRPSRGGLTLLRPVLARKGRAPCVHREPEHHPVGPRRSLHRLLSRLRDPLGRAAPERVPGHAGRRLHRAGAAARPQ